MEFIKAFVLGIIEGVTEFLPISSTAHLLIAQDLMNFKDETALFTVVVQFGAILSAVWYFRHDLYEIINSAINLDKKMLHFIQSIALGVLPSIVIGLIVEKTVGLPDSLWIIAISLIFGGVIMIVVENRVRARISDNKKIDYDSITVKRSLYIGIAQCLAIIPGVSRSGATIISGLLVGLNRKTATVFSFYLSVPVMFGASLLKLIDGRSAINSISGGSVGLVIGLVSALISAFLAVKWLLGYVQKNNFKPFGYYRIGLGVVILFLLLTGLTS